MNGEWVKSRNEENNRPGERTDLHGVKQAEKNGGGVRCQQETIMDIEHKVVNVCNPSTSEYQASLSYLRL